MKFKYRYVTLGMRQGSGFSHDLMLGMSRQGELQIYRKGQYSKLYGVSLKISINLEQANIKIRRNLVTLRRRPWTPREQGLGDHGTVTAVPHQIRVTPICRSILRRKENGRIKFVHAKKKIK